MNFKHHDCRNFLPVDAAKGICNRTKQMVLIDSPVCENFNELPKCRNCSNYAAGGMDKETLGICEAGSTKPWTFEDLIAVNCEMYVKK